MVLTGDPALKLFGTSLPIIRLMLHQFHFPHWIIKLLTSISNSFGLKIIVKNLGACASYLKADENSCNTHV